MHRIYLLSFSLLIACPLLAQTDDLFPIFNARIGTQTFDPKYQFTSDTPLLETAKRIYEMGSDIIKFNMNKRWSGSGYGLAPNDEIRSLVDLAEKEPSYRAVFEMPFYYYLLWTYPFQEAQWHNGLSPEEAQREYKQIYEFTCYLLKSHNETGKTFLLGHWEGDWWLLGATDAAKNPTDTAVQGMIDWLTVRQKAVEQAKRDTPHSRVDVLHYTEVNLVKKAIDGGIAMTTDVLPHVELDLISYSAYDTANSGRAGQLHMALRHIQNQARLKGPFSCNVFIGEYGFPLDFGRLTPDEQNRMSLTVMQEGLKWGAPFVLYWQMYDNEAQEGGAEARGFWLIDKDNKKQPIYHTHRDILAKAHTLKDLYRFWMKRNPSETDMNWLANLAERWKPTMGLIALMESPEFKERISDEAFYSLLARYPTQNRSALQDSFQKAIQYSVPRYRMLLDTIDNPDARSVFSDQSFAEYLAQNLLEDNESEDELAQRLQKGEQRSTLWLECLDDTRFQMASLKYRTDHSHNSTTRLHRFFFNATADN